MPSLQGTLSDKEVPNSLHNIRLECVVSFRQPYYLHRPAERVCSGVAIVDSSQGNEHRSLVAHYILFFPWM